MLYLLRHAKIHLRLRCFSAGSPPVIVQSNVVNIFSVVSRMGLGFPFQLEKHAEKTKYNIGLVTNQQNFRVSKWSLDFTPSCALSNWPLAAIAGALALRINSLCFASTVLRAGQ